MIWRISSRPKPPHQIHPALIQLLQQNQDVHLAYIDPESLIPRIIAHVTNFHAQLTPQITHNQTTYEIEYRITEQNQTLTLPAHDLTPQSAETTCQNAPIKLGCQIQPHGKNWVGTAGGPIKFKDPTGRTRWGFITNAHVSGTPTTPTETQLHQPTDRYPAIARTTIYAYPAPNQVNTLDVALADSQFDDAHKTSWEILNIGKPATTWTNATLNTPVIKNGRTTSTTHGKVTATNAVARVNYGTFIATMADLDVIQSSGQFSAPGDSGSLILHAETKQPLSLLFAGSSQTTLAIPIRNIAKAIQLSFKP